MLGENALQGDVAGQERIALAQRAHGDVLRGPFADPRQGPQARHRLVEIASRIEQAGIGEHGRGQARQGGGARPGHAERGDAVDVEAFGARKGVRQPVRPDAAGDALAEGGDQLGGKAPGGGYGDLLAEDRAHRDLEPIPGARHPKSRARRDEGRQGAVAAELGGDHGRVGPEVEHPADAGDDRRQGLEAGKADRHPQRRVLRRIGDLDGAGRPADVDDPAVDIARHDLDAGDRARGEEADHRSPVIGRPVGQQEADGPAVPVRQSRGAAARSVAGGRR